MTYGIDKNTLLYLRGDSLNNIAPGAITMNTSVNAPTISNNKLIFNGSSTHTEAYSINTSLTLSGDFTFEAWCCADVIDGFNLFANRVTETCFLVGHKTSSADYIANWIGKKDSWDVLSSHSYGLIPLNINNHFAYVRKGTTYYAFLNGTLIGTRTASAVNLGLNGTNIGQQSIFKLWGVKISNVARYTDDFTPSNEPLTSVDVVSLSYEDDLLSFIVAKHANETIRKIEVLLNNVVIKTIDSQTLDTGDSLYIKDKLLYGINHIEIKAYYFDDDHYVSKTMSIEKPIDKLTNNATFENVIEHTNKIKSNISTVSDMLSGILNDKGIFTGTSPTLAHLVELVGQLSNTNDSEVTNYLNQISELTSRNTELIIQSDNNKLALVNALIAKNIECSMDEDYSSLINKISLFEEVVGGLRYLYSSGDTCDSITGGYVTKYSFTSASVTYNANNILIKANAGLSGGASVISTKSMIDITKYKYLKARVNINSVSTNGGFVLYVKKTFGSYPWDNNVASSTKYSTLGAATITLDISTLSGSHYIALGIDAGSSGSATMSATVYELWLE